MNLRKSRIIFGVLLMMFTMGFFVMKRREKTAGMYNGESCPLLLIILDMNLESTRKCFFPLAWHAVILRSAIL